MVHPWFNKPTLGIIYVPGPSVEELALPLAATSYIDPDLLASLRVIWGKHGDIEKIKADLLSPAGEGTITKAFYFLLQQYREQTQKDYGVILDLGDTPVSPGVKVVTRRYRSPPPKKRTEADTMARHTDLQSNRGPLPPPSHTPPAQLPLPPSRTPSPQLPGLTLPPTSRSRLVSPIGPRPPRVRSLLSRVREAPTRHRSLRVGHVTESENSHSRLPSRTRATTVSMYPRANQDPHSYLAYNHRMFQPLTVPSTSSMGARFPGAPVHPVNPCIIRAPVPISAVAHEQVSANFDIEMQSSTDSDADWVIIHSAWHDVIQGQDQPQTFHSPTREYPDVGRHSYISPRGPGANYDYLQTDDSDKENQPSGFQQPYLESNVMQTRGRLFGGRLNEGRVGRESRNTFHGAHDVLAGKAERSRRRDFFLVWACF